jgi:retron-type reverse transcriptase
MKRVGHLFERIVTFENLMSAAQKAFRGNKKYKGRGAAFYLYLEPELLALEEKLRSGTYRPVPYNTFAIYEPKQRHISASDFRDRVVHHAICNLLEPLLDRGMIFDSYACRVGKGAHAAVKRAQTFARRFRYVLKCDIRKYFETIDHDILKQILARKIKDPKLLDLLSVIIDHAVPEYAPGKGLPIGALTSQLFANLYLSELDHLMKDELRIAGYLRYMDDFLTFSQTKTKLHNILLLIREFVTDRLLLELKEDTILVTPVSQGIPFLGFRVFPGLIRLDRRHLIKFQRKIRAREQAYQHGEIEEEMLVRSVNSMIAHIAHANTYQMRKALFWG